ncbi:hypothetical protein, partial [Mesorhizobium sp. M4B.F.Ca.ET.017.02.2.1]|uniref:hypothetical protein n=1 Tax=Mesorhizobium sp. M4B.F.Ca.ET.017.02.2.1 TaxID=2496649 RepID=UPI001AECE95D
MAQQPDRKTYLPQACRDPHGDGGRAVTGRTGDDQGDAFLAARGGKEPSGHQQHDRPKKAHDPQPNPASRGCSR